MNIHFPFPRWGAVEHPLPGDGDVAAARLLSIRPLDPAPPVEDLGEVPTVRLKRGFLSARPQVVDDFSGNGLMSALRSIARIRNLDGPDDVAGALSLSLSPVDRPYVEIGLLSAFFPLVAVAAKGAVQSARASYAQDYPDNVRQTLDQQRRLIDALRHGNRFGAGESDDDLQTLIDLHAQGVRRFETRQAQRERGFLPLVKHNLQSKWRRTPGNTALSETFNQEAARLIAARFARNWRLDTVETTYQAHLSRDCESQQRAGKRQRVARLFTGIGLPSMALGMATSTGKSVATAVGNGMGQAGNLAAEAVAQTVGQALGTAAGGTMMGAQVAQGTSGALNLRLHAAEHRRIRRDREAVQAVAAAGHLPEPIRRLYAQDAAARLADSARSQVCDAMLVAGQGMMLTAGASSLACPPLAPLLGPALAVPGAAITLGASLGAARNELHFERYRGEQTEECLKEEMRLGNLGERLRDEPLGVAMRQVADGFEHHQDGVPLVRLWNDVLKVLADEARPGTKPRSGAERHRRLVACNEGGLIDVDGAHLLPAGRERLRRWREERFPATWFDAPLATLQERLGLEMQRHPAAPAITSLAAFRQQVFFDTARDLARRRDSATQALFRDERGRPLKVLKEDARWARHLAEDPEARASHRRHHNEQLAKRLTPVDRFGRAEHRDALTDLAYVKAERDRRHGVTPPPQHLAPTPQRAGSA